MSQDFLDRQYLEGFIDHAKALEVQTNKVRLNRFDFFMFRLASLSKKIQGTQCRSEK